MNKSGERFMKYLTKDINRLKKDRTEIIRKLHTKKGSKIGQYRDDLCEELIITGCLIIKDKNMLDEFTKLYENLGEIK